MKRNKENKSRIQLFATFHLKKSSQQKLDNIIKIGSLKYTKLWHDIKVNGLHKTIYDLIESATDDCEKEDEFWYINTYRNACNDYISELHSMEYVMRYSLKMSKDSKNIWKTKGEK